MTRIWSAVSIALLLTLSACFKIPLPADRLQAIGRPSGERLPEHVRVLVWNIHKSDRASWRAELEFLATRHDVFLFQEAWWDDETRPIFAAENEAIWWLGATFYFPWRAGAPRTGTLIGSRARAVAPIVFHHSPFRDAISNTPKSHIAGTFALADGTELLVVSVHATNFHIEQRPFNLHVDQIFDTIAAHRVAGQPGPVILAGDFNTWSEARTEYLFRKIEEHGFVSVYPRGPAEAAGDGRMSWCDNYLDHAFIRDLELEGTPSVVPDREASDHRALSFTVSR